MPWTAYTTVAAIIESAGRFLLVEEKSDTGAVVINQPVGHLNEGESVQDAVVRETREETAWRFHPRGLVGVYRWQVSPGGKTYIRFCFFGDGDDHRPEQPLDPEILGTKWMTRDELAGGTSQLRSPMVLICINDYLSGCRHSLELLRDLG